MMNFSKTLAVCSSSWIIFHLVIISFPLNITADMIGAKNDEKVPAVIVFGDSIVDPGNNNYVKTVVKCNFPPYGRDLFGRRPTGRFSNGKIPSDIMGSLLFFFWSEMLRLKFLVSRSFLPAYLDPSLQLQDLLTGVSFASGGAGYDPLTAKLVSVLSLSEQLDLFQDYLMKIKSAVGEERTAAILSKSIYIICEGSNDIANTYFSTPFREPHYDINSYTDLMINSALIFSQELYGLGARRIGIVNLPPLGCLPSQRTLAGGIERSCAESTNQAAMFFNSKLSPAIVSLNRDFPDARFVYFDIYKPLISIIESPAQLGFQVATRGCCGTGNMEVSIPCNGLDDPHTCKDASKYIFWDSFHPTEKAYQFLTRSILNKDLNKFF